MKNLDVISKRIFVSAISVSMILLCASLLVFALNTIPQAKANSNLPFAKPSEDRLTKVDIWPFGIVGGKAYWMEYNDSGWNFRNSDVSLWKSAD
ncbi:MAG: hypothetical protein HY841_04705 [Bacteroidetes bacterium]|nr:hypothetical protein [Bacteroidota bacterium]